MFKSYSYKLYPNQSQIKAMDETLRACCWIHNQAIEQRIKVYKRRKESVSLFDQDKWLTLIRGKKQKIGIVNRQYEFDAIRRVDLAMRAFFRRLKAGQKPGFPRFKPAFRYCSFEHMRTGKYLRGARMFLPGIGAMRCIIPPQAEERCK